MEMSIDESISELKWVRKVNEEILKTDAKEIDVDSAWIKHWENVVKSLDVAIDTMRKYQQLQADYENRLKADMVAMLTEIQLEIDEKATELCDDGWWITYNDIIQQKIDKLKEDKDGRS